MWPSVVGGRAGADNARAGADNGASGAANECRKRTPEADEEMTARAAATRIRRSRAAILEVFSMDRLLDRATGTEF